MKHHILIVEDEKKIADLVRDYLVNDGYTVSWLDRGDGVAAHVKQTMPDLILLDIMLPGMDGIEVCKRIRAFSKVPIIMVTARIEEIDRILGLEIGADDYVCKPFSPREVMARVKAVLRRASPSASDTVIQAGPVRLDSHTRELTVEGTQIPLTPSEYEILAVMLKSPNRVFSRAQLIQHAQGYDFEGYERTVDSHIKNLRKKITSVLPDNDCIVSVYGVGYKLMAAGS